MTEGEERRALARITVDGRVRVRLAGEGGGGHLCRVRDANADGARLVVEDLEGLDEHGLDRLEVLTASARPQQVELEMEVVWIERRNDGLQHLGCSFV